MGPFIGEGKRGRASWGRPVEGRARPGMATASAALQLAGARGELGVLPGRAVSGKTGGVEAGSARGVARGQPRVDAGVRRRHDEKQREEGGEKWW